MKARGVPTARGADGGLDAELRVREPLLTQRLGHTEWRSVPLGVVPLLVVDEIAAPSGARARRPSHP